MPLVATDAGWNPAVMDTSDTHLFTSAIGKMLAGDDLHDLGVHLDGERVDLGQESPVHQAAHLIWLQYLTRMQKRSGAYWDNLVEDVTNNADYHRGEFRDQLEGVRKRAGGLAYRSETVWDHLDRVADDPSAVVISNPPTYVNAYEKFFDTDGRLTWDGPEYEPFDAPRDIPRMVERMEGAKALLIVQQQQSTRNSAHPRPIYARQLAPDDLVYLNSNRPDEMYELMGGFKVVRKKAPPIAKRPWPILPEDYEVTPETRIELRLVESKVADAYRREWMHRLYPVPGSGNVLLLLDGYAAGVMGYSTASISSSYSLKWAKHAILRFAFGAKHRTLRLTRLATMLALQHDTLWLTQTPVSTLHIASAEGLVTSEMTRFPESKGLRGLMKIQDRQKHPDGYKLVYAANWRPPATPQQVLAEFLTKEAQWRKSREQSQKPPAEGRHRKRKRKASAESQAPEKNPLTTTTTTDTTTEGKA